MNYEEAIQVTGGLSKASKMPCHGYNLPAQKCKIGAKLRKIAGSVCHRCYALKGNYLYPVVKNKLEERLRSITNSQWVDGMVYLISLCSRGKYVETYGQRRYRKLERYFRFHDSGDLQSVDHLMKIVEIAKRVPYVKFWLPTREYHIVKQAKALLKDAPFPTNLIIRLSAHLIDGPPPTDLAKELGVVTSSVHNHEKPIGKLCTARSRNNMCGQCRACWDQKVENVSYVAH